MTTTTARWLTTAEVAEAARMSRSTIYRMWACGEGPRHSQVGNRRLVREDWLQDWLMAGEVAA